MVGEFRISLEQGTKLTIQTSSPSRMERGEDEDRNMNQIVLTINGHKVKVTTDQEITEAWKTEMIEWITNEENKLRG